MKKKQGAPNKTLKSSEENCELSPYSTRKRQLILAAAIETFLEFGYEGASMNLVAERAGVIKQTIYSHFQDKETLFVETIASLTIQTFAELSTESAETPEQQLRKFADTFVNRPENPVFTKVMRTIVGESDRFPMVAKLFTEATIKPGIEKLTRFLDEHRDINLEDPEAFARVFIGTLVHYNMQQHILYGSILLPFDSLRLINELLRIFTTSCLSPEKRSCHHS